MSDQAERLEEFLSSKPDDAPVAQIADLMRVSHDPRRSALAYGYSPHPDQREPFGVIYIAEWRKDEVRPKLGDFASEHDWREALGSQFRDDAEAVFRVLSSNLPGGTMYELFVAFLRYNTNLHVVQDEPAVTIGEIARAFVWEPEQWEAYTDSKDSNSVAWPPEWLLLCQAVEKRYGPPPVEPEPRLPLLYPYCVTCKERCAVAHIGGNHSQIEAFLALHPSPDHVVDPKWQDEIDGNS